MSGTPVDQIKILVATLWKLCKVENMGQRVSCPTSKTLRGMLHRFHGLLWKLVEKNGELVHWNKSDA